MSMLGDAKVVDMQVQKTLRDVVNEKDPNRITLNCFGGVFGCPSDYKYLNNGCNAGTDTCIRQCTECWNQPYVEKAEEKEMKNTQEPAMNKPEEDPVNRPSHYNHGGMETIDEMIMLYGIQETMSYCKLNAHKYRARAPYKGKPEEDMKKADWYLAKYKELRDDLIIKRNSRPYIDATDGDTNMCSAKLFMSDFDGDNLDMYKMFGPNALSNAIGHICIHSNFEK